MVEGWSVPRDGPVLVQGRTTFIVVPVALVVENLLMTRPLGDHNKSGPSLYSSRGVVHGILGHHGTKAMDSNCIDSFVNNKKAISDIYF